MPETRVGRAILVLAFAQGIVLWIGNVTGRDSFGDEFWDLFGIGYFDFEHLVRDGWTAFIPGMAIVALFVLQWIKSGK